MSFTLIDSDWSGVFARAASADRTQLRIICPFLKYRAVEKLLTGSRIPAIQVITRFNLADFADGVSDISALRLLLAHGAQIRGLRHLHAKVYVFGHHSAIATSANLTTAAMHRNHEFGFVADDQPIVARCHTYFEHLWGQAGANLPPEKLDPWERKVTEYLASGLPPARRDELQDEGVEPGTATEEFSIPEATDQQQAFVKFFGLADERDPRTTTIAEELEGSGSHWACTYPKGRRPRQVSDGATMFMARLVSDPDDILIYGRAIGMKHDERRDDASAADLALRPWKAQWPHYIRVHHGEFVAGTLANGVSLYTLMRELGADVFRSTSEHKLSGDGNTDPRKAYSQQPAVELSQTGRALLQQRLERAFELHGKLAPDVLNRLDWPTIHAAR